MSTAVRLIRELDSLIDADKLARMSDFQLGWFWKIFNTMRLAPHFRLPFDANFWALAGARTKGYWDNNSALVVSCFKVQMIAGQTWIWHEGLVRLAEAGSQSQTQSDAGISTEIPQKSERESIKDLFLLAYKNYPKHVGKDSAEKKFYIKAKKHAKEQHCSLIDAAESIAHKCDEYAACVKLAGIPKQYIPAMSRWLNEGRYGDDPTEWAVDYKLSGKEKPSKLKENFNVIDQMEF